MKHQSLTICMLLGLCPLSLAQDELANQTPLVEPAAPLAADSTKRAVQQEVLPAPKAIFFDKETPIPSTPGPTPISPMIVPAPVVEVDGCVVCVRDASPLDEMQRGSAQDAILRAPASLRLWPAETDLRQTLVNRDLPARWGALPHGPMKFSVQIPWVDDVEIDAIQFWVDSEQVSQRMFKKRQEAVVQIGDLSLIELEYWWNCPPLGRHLLQTTYLRGGRWSGLSDPVRFNLLPPPTPKIIAIGSDGDANQPGQKSAAKLRRTATLKLAHVQPEATVAIDIDGQQVATAVVDATCGVQVDLTGLLATGRYQLTVRTIDRSGCGISSEASMAQWIDVFDETTAVQTHSLLTGSEMPFAIQRTAQPLVNLAIEDIVLARRSQPIEPAPTCACQEHDNGPICKKCEPAPEKPEAGEGKVAVPEGKEIPMVPAGDPGSEPVRCGRCSGSGGCGVPSTCDLWCGTREVLLPGLGDDVETSKQRAAALKTRASTIGDHIRSLSTHLKQLTDDTAQIAGAIDQFGQDVVAAPLAVLAHRSEIDLKMTETRRLLEQWRALCKSHNNTLQNHGILAELSQDEAAICRFESQLEAIDKEFDREGDVLIESIYADTVNTICDTSIADRLLSAYEAATETKNLGAGTSKRGAFGKPYLKQMDTIKSASADTSAGALTGSLSARVEAELRFSCPEFAKLRVLRGQIIEALEQLQANSEDQRRPVAYLLAQSLPLLERALGDLNSAQLSITKPEIRDRVPLMIIAVHIESAIDHLKGDNPGEEIAKQIIQSALNLLSAVKTAGVSTHRATLDSILIQLREIDTKASHDAALVSLNSIKTRLSELNKIDPVGNQDREDLGQVQFKLRVSIEARNQLRQLHDQIADAIICQTQEAKSLASIRDRLAKISARRHAAVQRLEFVRRYIDEHHKTLAQAITLRQGLTTAAGIQQYIALKNLKAQFLEQQRMIAVGNQIADTKAESAKALADHAAVVAKQYWKEQASRQQAADAILTAAPPTTTVFHSPANFPRPRFGTAGLDDAREGLIIREGMELVTNADGSFTVTCDVMRAAIPATLHLQLAFKTTTDGPWYTLSLEPRQLRPGGDNMLAAAVEQGVHRADRLTGNYQPMAYDNRYLRLQFTGEHPALKHHGGRVVRVRRGGSARYGYGFEGLNAYDPVLVQGDPT